MRTQFINNGILANTFDTNFRAISDDWPVFAFAQDLGTVSGTSDTVVFTIGHVRDPAVEYIIAGGAYQARSLYAWSAYPYGVGEMVSTAFWYHTSRSSTDVIVVRLKCFLRTILMLCSERRSLTSKSRVTLLPFLATMLA